MNISEVSILLVTYNHERYITQAIESILIQKVDFDYEIIVADDCSTDNTIKIINEYAIKYPDKFKIVKNKKNLGITKNYQQGFKNCKNEFIAVLEGDDYWSSPLKLKIQAEFLKQNQEYSFCFNRVLFLNEDSQESFVHPNINFIPSEENLSTISLCKDNFTGNFSSGMYRKSNIEKISPSFYNLTAYDWFFNIINSEFGKIGFIPDALSVYRIHQKSVWSSLEKKSQYLKLIEQIKIYDEFTSFKYTLGFKEYTNSLLNQLSNFETKPIVYLPLFKRLINKLFKTVNIRLNFL